jgi:TolB protein
VFLVLALVLVALAACGGDDDDAENGSPTVTPVVTNPGNAITPPPVSTGDGSGPEPFGRIAFYSFRDDREGENACTDCNQNIFVMNPDGSDQTRLTDDQADDYEPDWSPDGTKIAFASAREGSVHVFVMNADGTDQVQLTPSPGGYLSPRWSTDGTRIALSQSGTLMVMNADGSDLRTIFEPQPEDQSEPCRGPGFPGGWSPDSKRVTYYSASVSRQLAEICIVDVDTGEIEVVVQEPPAVHAEPVWSADGRYLAYRSIRGENSDIYTFDLETREERRLTDVPEVDAEPEFSPDGEWIAFVSYRAYPNSDVYIMRKDGSDVRRLTDDPAKDTYPVWTE